MTPEDLAQWMYSRLQDQGCVYQDESVGKALYPTSNEHLYRVNDDGNIVLATGVLAAFRKMDNEKVVWVKPDRYWRWRCSTDEPGREQRG
ncbi:DUF6953 family protein [Variovorax saccharolyticus]|uniref:DUF6953 family protein n=1 Tax=Variovorax saccharolyticus TaxID=3053516 RepID=UPI00403776AB|nr:hypothetical protein [Variovorax sp. J22R187]